MVIKRGEKGIFARKGETIWQFDPEKSGIKPTKIVDNTGAGDNFDAGFLRAWLLGKDMEACFRLGHRCAVSSLASPGGIRGQLKEKIPSLNHNKNTNRATPSKAGRI